MDSVNNIAKDAKAGKLYYQIPYYYMGQITRFVLPDSYHIDTKVRPFIAIVMPYLTYI